MQNIFLNSLILDSAPAIDIPSLIGQAGWVVKSVMALLFLASIISWTIIFWKWWTLRIASNENLGFADTFWASGTLEGATRASKHFPNAPLKRVFDGAMHEFGLIKGLSLSREQTIELIESNLARSLQKASSTETEGLQKYLAFLASTASVAPFIGLFGTVWGIMTSFINIGLSGASNLAVVAPGIAEALIATAIGLFAAIPAVLFYNFFINRIRGMATVMSNFSTDFLNTAKRSL